jgi:hypothetical protein
VARRTTPRRRRGVADRQAGDSATAQAYFVLVRRYLSIPDSAWSGVGTGAARSRRAPPTPEANLARAREPKRD